MPAVVNPLDGLAHSAESRIIGSFFASIKADARFSAFNPWRLMELVHGDQILEMGVYTGIVAVPVIRIEDWPSERETVRPVCEVAFGLPWEQTSEDSKLYGLRLNNLVRIKANELAYSGLLDTVVSGSVKLADATVDVRPLPLLSTPDKGVRWARSHVTWQTDIKPRDGSLVT